MDNHDSNLYINWKDMKKIITQTLQVTLIMIVGMSAVFCLAFPIGMILFGNLWWLFLIPLGFFLGKLQEYLINKSGI